VFLRDRLLGTTERLSLDSAGVEGNATSLQAALSPDGRYLAFSSFANNLVAGDTNGRSDIFRPRSSARHDRNREPLCCLCARESR
jgi:hypothetical protein